MFGNWSNIPVSNPIKGEFIAETLDNNGQLLGFKLILSAFTAWFGQLSSLQIATWVNKATALGALDQIFHSLAKILAHQAINLRNLTIFRHMCWILYEYSIQTSEEEIICIWIYWQKNGSTCMKLFCVNQITCSCIVETHQSTSNSIKHYIYF